MTRSAAAAVACLLLPLIAAGVRAGDCSGDGDDAMGPYYVAGTAHLADLGDGPSKGLPARIEGRVFGGEAGVTPLPDATVEVWHDGGQGPRHASAHTGAGGRFAVRAAAPAASGLHYRVRAAGHEMLDTRVEMLATPALQPETAAACRRRANEEKGGRLLGLIDLVLRPGG